MNRRLGIGLVLIAAAAVTGHVIVDAPEAAARTGKSLAEAVAIEANYPVSRAASVAIHNENGAVTVTAWDGPHIEVRAAKQITLASDAGLRARFFPTRPSPERLQALLNAMTVRVDRDSDGIRFDTQLPAHVSDAEIAVAYDLRVPRSCAVRVDSVNGSVAVSDITGPVDVKTINGRISCRRLDGPVRASSINGEITSDHARGPARLESRNGPVTVRRPQGPVTVLAHNGDVLLDEPAASVDARSRNGAITIRRLNASTWETPLYCESHNGDIDMTVGPAGLARAALDDVPPARLVSVNGAITIRNADQPKPHRTLHARRQR
jgi:DUF4097 and DUF4098 domain-containing protein YvlB